MIRRLIMKIKYVEIINMKYLTAFTCSNNSLNNQPFSAVKSTDKIFHYYNTDIIHVPIECTVLPLLKKNLVNSLKTLF